MKIKEKCSRCRNELKVVQKRKTIGGVYSWRSSKEIIYFYWSAFCSHCGYEEVPQSLHLKNEESKQDAKKMQKEDLAYNLTEDIMVILERRGKTSEELIKILPDRKQEIIESFDLCEYASPSDYSLSIDLYVEICFALGISMRIYFPELDKSGEG